MKVREFIRIIEDAGFVVHRQGATSHRRFRGVVDGKVQFVDVSVHGMNDDLKPNTLASMIRQSGLPKARFRS